MCAFKILFPLSVGIDVLNGVDTSDVSEPARCAALHGMLRCSSAWPSVISVAKKAGPAKLNIIPSRLASRTRGKADSDAWHTIGVGEAVL